MILTALVQTKGGTLVVDLPRDRIDLEMKIRSVGIERLSDQIRYDLSASSAYQTKSVLSTTRKRAISA